MALFHEARKARIARAAEQPESRREYVRRLAACQELASKVKLALEAHNRRSVQDPRNWGFAGDLASVQAELETAFQSLGGESALNQLRS